MWKITCSIHAPQEVGSFRSSEHHRQAISTYCSVKTRLHWNSAFLAQGPLKALLQCKQHFRTATHTLTISIHLMDQVIPIINLISPVITLVISIISSINQIALSTIRLNSMSLGWEETGVLSENPSRHGENMQTSHSKTLLNQEPRSNWIFSQWVLLLATALHTHTHI